MLAGKLPEIEIEKAALMDEIHFDFDGFKFNENVFNVCATNNRKWHRVSDIYYSKLKLNVECFRHLSGNRSHT